MFELVSHVSSRNGRWCSQWNFSIESGKISGSMRVCVHYYEDGNVQLNTSKNETQSLATDGQSTAVIATKLKQIVKEFETKFQSALNENYARMSDTTFKGMRRALPVTKSKLDWAKISSYKIGHNISR